MIQEINYIPANNLIMACLITGVYDVNRNETLVDDNYELVRHWAESITALKLNGIIFHNNFSVETCQEYSNEYISFKRISFNSSQFNPNVYRYFVYRDFLDVYENQVENIFITDISDVVVIKNPFEDSFFMENAKSLFCGDEPKTLNNEWMVAHSSHFRNKISDYSDYESNFANEKLLNCGIIGGKTSILYPFLKDLCAIHQRFNFDNQTAYTGDMGAFNYLARTRYNSQLKYGVPVNTLFKGYELERDDCWFRHK